MDTFSFRIQMTLFLFLLMTLGCESDLNSRLASAPLQSEDNQSGISQPNPQPVEPVTPNEPKTPDPKPVGSFLVGVGNGGYKISSDIENFNTNYEFNVPSSLSNASPPNCGNIGAVVMDVGAKNRCCFSHTQECFGPGNHSDFLFRGLTYGNGKFVAVGGWNHGIITSTTDGINWSEKINLHPSNNLVVGSSQSGSNWIPDVAYGLGRFVAVSGGGYLFYSNDAYTWHNDSASGSSGATLRTIASLDEKGFIATGDSGRWAYTQDGKTWTKIGQANTHPDRIKGRLYSLAYGDPYVLANISFMDGKTRIFRFNTEKIDEGWTEVSKINTRTSGIIHNSDTDKFYTFGHHKMFTSTNGDVWNSVDTNFRGSGSKVVYSNSTKTFAAWGGGRGKASVFTSKNGTEWQNTEVASSEVQGIRAIAVGDL